MAALRRIAVGPFAEQNMISLEELEALCHRAAAGEGSLADALFPVATALDDIPALAVSRADAARLQRGQAVLMRSDRIPTCTSGDPVSPAFLACAWMTSALRSAVIDIVNDLPIGRLCLAVRRG